MNVKKNHTHCDIVCSHWYHYKTQTTSHSLNSSLSAGHDVWLTHTIHNEEPQNQHLLSGFVGSLTSDHTYSPVWCPSVHPCVLQEPRSWRGSLSLRQVNIGTVNCCSHTTGYDKDGSPGAPEGSGTNGPIRWGAGKRCTEDINIW